MTAMAAQRLMQASAMASRERRRREVSKRTCRGHRESDTIDPESPSRRSAPPAAAEVAGGWLKFRQVALRRRGMAADVYEQPTKLGALRRAVASTFAQLPRKVVRGLAGTNRQTGYCRPNSSY